MSGRRGRFRHGTAAVSTAAIGLLALWVIADIVDETRKHRRTRRSS
ncbi:MAG: hypothetical protein ACRDZO_21485 [Egibacteraceae bacterium]